MRDWFSALWTPGAGYGELRAIKRGSPPRIKQVFVDLSIGDDAYTHAADTATEADRAGWDVYFGVLRRNTTSGTAADVVSHAPVLWADLDPHFTGYGGPLLPDGWGEPLVLNRLHGFPISPSIIVDSGHGIHAYWLLRDAAPVADASLAMKGIAKDIGGDHTHDPARILRVPGSYNYKSDPVPVRLLRLDTTRRYRFSDFSEWVDKAHEGRGTPHSWFPPARSYERRTDLPPWLDELIANGVPKGGRSEACFKAINWLIKFGWTDDEIRHAFLGSREGLGERYWERGTRLLDRDLEKARRAA